MQTARRNELQEGAHGKRNLQCTQRVCKLWLRIATYC